MVFSANSFSSRNRKIFPTLSSMQRTIPKYLERVDWLSFLTPFDPPVTQPGRFCKAARTLRDGDRLLEGQVVVHRVVGSPHGIGSVRVGKSEHEAKGLFLVPLENVEGTVDQPIGGKTLLVGSIQVVARLAFFCGRRLAGHPRSVRIFSNARG